MLVVVVFTSAGQKESGHSRSSLHNALPLPVFFFFFFFMVTQLGGRVSVLFPEIHMEGKTVKMVANKICPPAGSCSPPLNLRNKAAVFDPAVPN